MNRRGFLGLLGLASAEMVLDPGRALWVPGRRTFFDLGASAAPVEPLALHPGAFAFAMGPLFAREELAGPWALRPGPVITVRRPPRFESVPGFVMVGGHR